MNLSDVFEAVAYKTLTPTELPGRKSHQHEIQGTASLRAFFLQNQELKGGLHWDNGKLKGTIRWYYFQDETPVSSYKGGFTLSDVRRDNPNRAAEWHMYYQGDFLSGVEVGDTLVLCKTKEGNIYGLVFSKGSAWLRAATVLFDLDGQAQQLTLVPQKSLIAQGLDISRRAILRELGLDELVPSQKSDEALVLAKFGLLLPQFPSTKQMSEFARSLVKNEVNVNDTDTTLTTWLNREEALFKALEKLVVEKRLAQAHPFSDVEDFIQFSLSVQNRRKSRMGKSLEHHLEELWRIHGIRYSAQKPTEGKRKPDFIFPSIAQYHDPAFNADLLIMLGVKSTCKDRWRQVISEAARIKAKHLCTLEAAISANQTEEMKEEHLTLVVPISIQSTYTAAQQREIMSVQDFTNFVRSKQSMPPIR